MSPWAWLLALLLIGLLIALNIWVRRLVAQRESGSLKIQVKRRLDLQHTLWIVEVDGRRLLLGSGREGIRLIDVLDSSPVYVEPPK